MGEMDQEDIDKLLADALGSDNDSDSAPMGQNDIDALLAEAGNSTDDTPMGQDDIDALLNEANDQNDSAPMGQNDIDALLNEANAQDEDEGASMGQDDIDALLNEANAQDEDEGASMGQDDIDALLNEANAQDEDEGASMGQDDIDALLNEANAQDEDEGASMGQDDIDALLNEANAQDEDEGASMGQDDIDSLLTDAINNNAEESLVDQNSIDDMFNSANDNVMAQDDIDALLSDNDSTEQTDNDIEDEIPEEDDEAGVMGQDDIDSLLAGAIDDDSDSDIDDLDFDDTDMEDEDLDFTDETDITDTIDSSDDDDFEYNSDEYESAAADVSADIQESIVSPEMTQPSYAPPPMPEIKAAASVPKLNQEQMQNIQESLALSGSSGEVENLAGQMSGLLGQLSERARRFQAAWLTADQEARELRHTLTLNQQKVHVLNGEKQSLHSEINTLRKQYSQIEGEKLAASEAHRTEIASLELQLREQESRNNMISSEIRSLKEELERARNETTGSDLESRRSRFELERITQELTAERQERQRLTRALENREKELQAMQAQSAGHASTLFLDELHRLVRRLESELDIRTSSAHEALSVIDRMQFIPEQEMYAATLRTAIAAAAGMTPDENDALNILDKQSTLGQESLQPAPPPGADTFKAALERFDFAKASAIASASMRSGEKVPLDFIKVIHEASVLRRPEITKYLDDMAAMLRGIKNLQEASDRARGKEGDTTEIMYVLIFDLLHTFVRMKLISRATTAIWDLFLELRGRFSFLTSDRQWKEYRDRLLSKSKVIA